MLVVLVCVVIVGALVWYFASNQVEDSPELIGNNNENEPDEGGLGSELYNNTHNPVGAKTPDTNPFDTNANPFESGYKNPF